MKIVRAEALLADRQLGRPATHVGERDPRRFLHDVAEVTGQYQRAGASHRSGLHEEDFASGAGDGKPGSDPGLRSARRRLLKESLATERLAQERLAGSGPGHRPPPGDRPTLSAQARTT